MSKLPPRNRVDKRAFNAAIAGLGGIAYPERKGRPVKAMDGGTLQRKTRLSPVTKDPERKAQRMEAQFGPQAAACREMPCVKCGKSPPKGGQNDPHHEPPVSLGGRDEDTVPVCRRCHCEREDDPTGGAAWWAECALTPKEAKRAVRVYMNAKARGEAA